MLTEAQVSALEKRRSKTVCLSPLETLMLLSPVPRDGTGQVVGSPGTGFKERSAAKNTSSRSYSPRLAPGGGGSGEKAVALTGKGREWVGLKAGNFNAEFMQLTRFDGNAFVPWIGGDLDDILCERFERIVGCDNCVSFAGMKLQIPADRYRCHYVRAKVSVLCRVNRRLAALQGRASWLSMTASAIANTRNQDRGVSPPRRSSAKISRHQASHPTKADNSICC